MSGIRRYQDIVAWQLAKEFHGEIAKLTENSATAGRNFAFRDQLLDASSSVSKNICEGFLRGRPLVFANFLDYALGSLGEAEDWLSDGITRNYFRPENCASAFKLARRCLTATVRLKQSQIRYAKQQSSSRRRGPS